MYRIDFTIELILRRIDTKVLLL